ncbi:MAG TPA: MFS transporter, partial [Pyrinomonadaceae bacterium]|nr:MFS transporter [Pyrinomonadaceae bacterium]
MLNRLKNFVSRYRGLSGNVLALSLVSLLNDTSSEIIYPLLPTFLALTLGASPFAIGVIEGVAEAIASFLKLFSGYFSDRFNTRKLPVFLGYSLAGIVRPLLAFVTTWQQVLFVRSTDRVGKGIRGAPRDALIAASVEPERRGIAFGFNRAADHLGAVFGPICASVLIYFLAENTIEPSARDYSRVFLFASDSCRDNFVADPEKFIEGDDPKPVATDAQLQRGGQIMDAVVAFCGGPDNVRALRTYHEHAERTVGE